MYSSHTLTRTSTQSNVTVHEAVRPSLRSCTFIFVAVEIFPSVCCHALSASLFTQFNGATGVFFLFSLEKTLLSLELDVIGS